MQAQMDKFNQKIGKTKKELKEIIYIKIIIIRDLKMKGFEGKWWTRYGRGMNLWAWESLNRNTQWDFSGGPVAKTLLSVQGVQVQSLVRELDNTCCN